MPVQTITADLIRNLRPPSRGQAIIRDDKMKGFAVRITAKGAISFLVHVSEGGVERRHTLGSHPALPVATAREAAKVFRQRHFLGQDPLGQIDRRKSAPDVADLWERYEREYLPHKATHSVVNERTAWHKYILPTLGKHLVDQLSPDDADKLHREITRSGKPVQANRVHSSLRKALNLAIRWGWVERNIAKGVKRNNEEPRYRYASENELELIWSALKRLENRTAADAIALLLLTGARRSEVLNAKWNDIDLVDGVWTKPAASTKQRRLHRIPLNPDAMEIINRRRMEVPNDSLWLFPGRDSSRPVTDIKRAWNQVRDQADLQDFRLNDLRHTFASQVVSGTGSLYVTSQLLGHRRMQTTAGYAHLLDETMRDAATQAGKRLKKRS